MTEPRIFESPDHGETVFARVPGESTRTLVSESNMARSMRQRIIEDQMWSEIRKLALTDPVMKDLADKMIMTYHLLKDNK